MCLKVYSIKAASTLVMMSLLFVLFISMTNVSADDGFGRLFTTSKQRALLDKIRRQPGYKSLRKSPRSVIKKPVNRNLNVNGVVIRGDGKNTVWINGKSNLKTSQPQTGVKVYNNKIRSDSVTLSLSGRKKNIKIKPGQAVDPRTGKVLDAYKVK